MSWHQIALLLVTIACIGVPMFHVLSIKEKEMHPNVKEIHDMQELRLENAKLRELIQKTWKWEKNGCYECPLEKDCKVLCVYDGDCGIAVEIEKELQELGIEESDD